MKLSNEGRKRLIDREGVRTKAYQDTKGIWTIGIGHTSMAGPPEVHPGLEITRQQVDEIFARDVVKYEQAVLRAIKKPMEQHEFDAYVSLCYNIGPSAFARSSTVRYFNEGDKERAASTILMWNRPPEVQGRRRTEYDQFRTPYVAKTPITPQNKDAGTGSAATTFLGSIIAALQTGKWQIAVGGAIAALAVWFIVYKLRNKK